VEGSVDNSSAAAAGLEHSTSAKLQLGRLDGMIDGLID
jgi:hypothetical protein